jgi:DNA ligase-1
MTKPMLAVNAEMNKIKYPVYASPKLDGIRCLIIDGVAKTRTLKDVPNKYVSDILSSPLLSGLDGELIVGNPTSKTVYRDTVSEIMAHDKIPDFTYYVFDVHNVAGGYRRRLHTLMDGVEMAQKQKYPQVVLHKLALIEYEADLLDYESECVEAGYEGIIVRANLDAPYKYGRSTVNEGSLLKVKRFSDFESTIIGFQEEMFNGNEATVNELGRTKRSTAAVGLSGKNTLGAFHVRDIETGVEFAIGTGLTAAERQLYWDTRDTLLGQIVKYKCFEVGRKIAPRHPVFLGFRSPLDL